MKAETAITSISSASSPARKYQFDSGFSWEDYARLKSKLSSAASNYIDYIYVCSHDKKDSVLEAKANAKRLILLSQVESISRIIINNKFDKRPKYWSQYYVQRAMEAALEEKVHPAICGSCGGSGKTIENNALNVCKACNGSGMQKKTNVWRCKQMNVDAANWSRDHKERYELFIDIYDSFQAEFDRLFHRSN